MIVASAIKHGDKLYIGLRHPTIIQDMIDDGVEPPIPIQSQGFVDEHGKFYTRKEALIEARSCGQVDKLIGGVLTSEDLWR